MRRFTRFFNTWAALSRVHRYADSQHEWTEKDRQALTELTGDQRWYRVAEQDAVDMLKKRMDNYAGKARKRWIYQNAPALIEQDKKLQQQQQRR